MTDATNYWRKQTSENPLFPDLIWSRPENRRLAGKLLIIGGNRSGFNAPAEAYAEAEEAGAGVTRVLLPDALRKTVGRIFPEAEFAPGTPSGSFGQPALAEFLNAAYWADGVLLAGSFGRNSETAILMEKFSQIDTGQLTFAGDAADIAIATPEIIKSREDTMLVLDFTQLQRLAAALKLEEPFASGMNLNTFIELLRKLSKSFPKNNTAIAVEFVGFIHMAVNGGIISTRTRTSQNPVTKIAAYAAVWWLQNPDKQLEGISSGILIMK